MGSDLLLRRKWTLRAHGRQVVFVKRQNESREHVIMKALLWALYLPEYPHLLVETSIGDRFKPDVVQLAPDGTPEAIYVENAPGFTLSVQWHPEYNAANDPVSRPLFAAFGAAARDWAARRLGGRLRSA